MSNPKKNLKHLLFSVLIAVVLTLIYAIIAPLLIVGSYDGLVILIGGIGLFLGSIAFYFIYIFFKSIQKLKWLFGGIGLLAVFMILNIGNADVSLINLFARKNLPEQYKFYQDISQPDIQFKNKTMKRLFDGDGDLEYYLTNENNLIVTHLKNGYKDNEEFTKKTYSKLDVQGNIIDSLVEKNESHETFFEGYHINEFEDYYRTWALNGDTSKRKIETHNENLSLNSDQENAFIKNIEETATFIYCSKNYFTDEQSEKRNKIFYFKNKEWNAFYCVVNPEKETITKGISNSNLLVHYKINPYQYFQKIKMERNDNNGGGTNDVWNGFLYSDIIMGNDTLFIKEAVQMDDHWKTQQQKIKNKVVGDLDRENQIQFLPYLVYSNPDLNYQLFANNSRKLYIIRNK